MGVRRFGRFIRLCLILYAVTITGLVGVELFWSRDATPASARAIVCLGGGASETMLGESTRARVERCVALYDAGVAPMIHFIGRTAAPLMADLAQAQGVPIEAIGVDPFSRSTLQNALFMSRLMSTGDRVIVVSDAFHLPRSWVAFRLMGFDDVDIVPSAERVLRPRPLLREAAATWFNAARAALWAVTPWLDPELRENLLI